MPSILVRASQRRAIRRAVELSCCVVRASDSKVIGKRAFDLSPDGMRVELADIDVSRGDVFHVCFRATDLAMWFYTDAVAERIMHGRRPKERGRSLGLEFRGLDPVKRLILRGALRKVPPPLPQRANRVDYAETIRRIMMT